MSAFYERLINEIQTDLTDVNYKLLTPVIIGIKPHSDEQIVARLYSQIGRFCCAILLGRQKSFQT